MHPLKDFADALDERRRLRKTRHALKDVLADPHLAKDIGLPHRARTLRKYSLW
ncbi:MAG: hypothetical protein HKN27_17660 [Silicimonas sp.]|nr:hypothetical protein [Silicimonas sp.]